MFKYEIVNKLNQMGFDKERALYVTNWLKKNNISLEKYLEQMNYLYGGVSNGLLPKNQKDEWDRILMWDYRR